MPAETRGASNLPHQTHGAKPLVPGQLLAHYEIVGELGRGGMGEVWCARDTRLDREVAIKVLPAEMGTDAERLQRFDREARTLASLNHAHVPTPAQSRWPDPGQAR